MSSGRSGWKNKFFLYESASSYHNKIRDILINHFLFENLSCYQEVPVKDLAPDYVNYYDCIDWFIDEYSLAIEIHGEQHYKPVAFTTGISYQDKIKTFNNIRYRDNRKKQTLLDGGYNYIAISYKEIKSLTPEKLYQIIIKEIHE